MKRLLGTAALGATTCSSDGMGSGYAVVDPMPSPARCENPIALLTGNARFAKKSDGAFELIVLVVLPDTTDLRFSLTTPPQAGELPITHSVGAAGLEIKAVPPPLEKSFSVTIAVDCADGPAQAYVTVFWNEGDIAAGTLLPVQSGTDRVYRGGAD